MGAAIFRRLTKLGTAMFKWLTNLVKDARIAFAYLGYERECKKQWVADAERTYSTTLVEQDIKARMADREVFVSIL